jgi:hypothetical protein
MNKPATEVDATAQRWSIDEAFQRLLKHHFVNPQIARSRLSQAIKAGEITLWWRKADGPWVADKPRRLHLYIHVNWYEKPDGSPHGNIVPAGYIPGPDLSEYEWALSADEVEALCTSAPERKSPVAAEIEPRGDAEHYRWDEIATELGARIYEGDIKPPEMSVRDITKKMLTFCSEKWGIRPVESHMRAKLTGWLKVYKRK